MSDYKVTTINESERLLINADKTIVLSDRTRLYFKEGKYIGSKANLTDDLELWEFAD